MARKKFLGVDLCLNLYFVSLRVYHSTIAKEYMCATVFYCLIERSLNSENINKCFPTMILKIIERL